MNMGRNNIEWRSGKWYNVFEKWSSICRKCDNVVFVTIFCAVFDYEKATFTNQQSISIYCRKQGVRHSAKTHQRAFVSQTVPM